MTVSEILYSLVWYSPVPDAHKLSYKLPFLNFVPQTDTLCEWLNQSRSQQERSGNELKTGLLITIGSYNSQIITRFRLKARLDIISSASLFGSTAQ